MKTYENFIQGELEIHIKKQMNLIRTWFSAMKNHNINTMNEFIEDGFDINILDANGNNALCYASTEMCKILIDNGIKLIDNAWFQFAYNGNLEMLKVFIDKGFNINVTDEFGRNVIALAYIHKHVSVANYLIKIGVDINNINDAGSTILMRCCMINVVDPCKLIKMGANASIKNRIGKTCIDYGNKVWKQFKVQDCLCEYQPENMYLLKDIALPEIRKKYDEFFNMSDIGLF